MEHLLKNWNSISPGKAFPKVLYTIPTGANPSGVTIPNERRKKIYELCCMYDLLIIEDDPYYFLQVEGETKLQSFFSMDKDLRVMRMDSFSKIISSGLRVGVVTAPTPLLNRLQLHMQAETLHTSSLSQAILLSLLKQWKFDGFKKHVKTIQDFYRGRRDALVAAAERQLKGLAEWNIPKAGMFLWFKLNDFEDTTSLIHTKAKEQKVLFVPGSAFSPRGVSSYIRASYSTASTEQMEEAMKRLASLIRENRPAKKQKMNDF